MEQEQTYVEPELSYIGRFELWQLPDYDSVLAGPDWVVYTPDNDGKQEWKVTELYVSTSLALSKGNLEGFGYVLIRDGVAYISGPETHHENRQLAG